MSDPAAANLADYVRSAAVRTPATVALIAEGTRLTWAEVDDLVTAAARGYRTSGLTEGDRVGLVLGNVVEFVLAYFGALRADLVAVPLHRDLTAPELAGLLDESGAKAVVVDPVSAPVVRSLDRGDLLTISVGSSKAGEVRFEDFLALGKRASGDLPGAATASNRDGERLAAILYTSGTSGSPKGAMLSHRALVASLEQVAALPVPAVATGDTVLGVLPLSHIYSLNGTLGAVVRHAATLVLADRVTPRQSLRLIQQAAVTNVPAVPALWAAWSLLPEFPEAMAGVRLAFNGSDALPEEIALRIKALLGHAVHQGYGLTEAAPGVTTTLSTEPRPGSVGRPLPGVELRLVDESGDDIDPEDGDPGEIVIRGGNLFSGYWPDGSDGPDQEGWFATGDVGFIDEEGDLYLVDRRKELIIVNGFNVYPREVEQALLQHGDVAEAAVVGTPDDLAGERVKAYVVLSAGGQEDVEMLMVHCASRLARFKRPVVIELVETLPYGATGKVRKGELGHGG